MQNGQRTDVFLLQELILLFAIISFASYIAVRFARINTIQFPIGLEDQKDNVNLSLEENQLNLDSKAYFLQMLPHSCLDEN